MQGGLGLAVNKSRANQNQENTYDYSGELALLAESTEKGSQGGGGFPPAKLLAV